MPEASAGKPFVIGNGPPKGFLLRLLDLFSSVWTGVGLVALILLYCAVGSAFPDPAEVLGYRSFNMPHLLRQRFELTEMEWFSGWPFQLLVGLLIVSLITVTLRRIPLHPLHYGVASRRPADRMRVVRGGSGEGLWVRRGVFTRRADGNGEGLDRASK